MKRHLYALLRIIIALDVLRLTARWVIPFEASAHALSTYGFPAAPLLLVIATVAGVGGGLALLLGLKTRLAAAAVVGIWLPQMSLFLALYFGYAGGVWPEVLQVLTALEGPLLVGGLFVIFCGGAGAWSVAAWRAKSRTKPAQPPRSRPVQPERSPRPRRHDLSAEAQATSNARSRRSRTTP